MKSLRDFSKETKEPLVDIKLEDLLSLSPYIEEKEGFKELSDDLKDKYDFSLDGLSAFPFPIPSDEEKSKIVEKFLKGIEKLLDPESNWTFLKPFSLSLKYCVKCNTCAEACHVYVGSGRKEIYRPIQA